MSQSSEKEILTPPSQPTIQRMPPSQSAKTPSSQPTKKRTPRSKSPKTQQSTSVKPSAEFKILFDESHDELLRFQVASDEEGDTWSNLNKLLQEIDCEATPYPGDPSGKGELTDELLNSYQVLVLGAPRDSFTAKEIQAIADFVVKKGRSVLIAQSYQSLDDNTRSINLLLEKFGLRTKPLLTYPFDKIHTTQFKPHYLTTEINQLDVGEPAYLETLNDQPRVVANLPQTEEHFLAAVETEKGRVVAIGDFVIFGEKKINEGDNRNLVLNIFKWLTKKNPLECFDAQFENKVGYGKTSTFSITFTNPHRKRLENISCLLESDAGAVILEPNQRIRSLPAGGQTQLRWNVEPQKIAFQSLRLTIDFPETTGYPPLFFDCAAYFECVPEVKIDMINLSQQHQAPEIVETGVTFEMQVMETWATNAKHIPLHLELTGPKEHVLIEPVEWAEFNRWRVTVLDEGEWKINLKVAELNQNITRLVRAYPSIQKQINDLEKNILIPLAYDVHHQLSQLRQELVSPVIQKIPFRLLTPEEQVRLIELPDDREGLLEALRAARKEQERNFPLVQYLLENIAPTFSVVHGCCIPYDPKLAAHLVNVVKQHPSYEEHLAYNFLSIDNEERYGQTWLKQNIAALLLHEKYGHGFFFTQTTIGKQLAILYRYDLAPGSDSEQLRSPYLRSLYTEYETSIQLIYDSTIIVNEGFATWLELTMLLHISELIGQAVYRRRDFLFSRDSSMIELAQDNEYFQKFQPKRVSKYQEGCEYLELIQGYFGTNFGPKCAVQAMIKATDIDLGITESGGQVRFSLSQEQIKKALLEDESNDARCDERLRAIHDVLREHQDQICEQQEKLQCHRSCLHNECPINSIINAKLRW